MKLIERCRAAQGFTLIEMMLVLIIVGAVISAAATVVPSMIRTAKLKDARALSEKIDLTLEGFSASNGRLPCPDTTGDGLEDKNADNTCPSYEGWLPFKTMGVGSGVDAWGMPYRYGVNALMTNTTASTVCSTMRQTPPAGSLQDTNGVFYAFIIVSGGEVIHGKTHAIAGGRFDLDNDDQDLVFETPDKQPILDEKGTTVAYANQYNDLVRGASINLFSGSQCTGAGSGGVNTATGGTTASGGTTALENTAALCADSLDNDSDGKTDCLDQDCFNIGACVTPSNTTISITQLTPNAKAGAYYASTAPSAIGGSNTYYWSLVSENLGNSTLSISNINTGVVVGTVNECPGTYAVTLKAVDRVTPYTSDQDPPLNLTVEYSDANTLTILPSGGSLVTTGTPNLTYNSGDSTLDQWFELNGNVVGDVTWTLEFTSGDPTGFTLTKDATNPKRAKLWISGHPVQRANDYTFIVKATHGNSCSPSQSVQSAQYTMKINGDFSTPAHEVGMNGYWKMDECSWAGVTDEVKDSQGENHHGKGVLVTGGTQTTTTSLGKVCRGGIFRGATTKNYVYIPDSATLQLGSNFSLAAWVKVIGNATDWVRIVGKGNSSLRNYGMWIATNGTVLFQIYSSTGATANAQTVAPNVINDGAWHHIVMTFDSSLASANMKVFIDNVQRAATNTTITPAVSTAPLTFGYAGTDAVGTGFHTYFNGMIDEVRIWNRALPTTEITDLYNDTTRSCSGTCYTTPIARYRMENSGADEIGGFNGTVGSSITYDGTTPKEGCATANFVGTGSTRDSNSIAVSSIPPLDDTGLATFAFWMNWNGTNSIMPINVGSGNNDMWLSGSNFGFNTGGGDIYGIAFPSAIYANVWTHVIASFAANDPNLYQLFINGQPQKLSLLQGTRNNRTLGTKFRLGSWENDNNYSFRGKEDDVRVYNRGLGSNEALGLYQEAVATCSVAVGITTSAIPATTMGDSTHTSYYTTTLTASGGTTPYSWEATSLPAGWAAAGWKISTNLTNGGTLEGPATDCPGTYTIGAKVTDATGATSSQDLTLTINKGNGIYTPALTSTSYLQCSTAGCGQTFTLDTPRKGEINWGSVNWNGASTNFSISKTGAAAAIFKENGGSSNGTYYFSLNATDASCPTNTFTIPGTGLGYGGSNYIRLQVGSDGTQMQ